MKLVNYQGKSVGLLVEVPRLCELPSIMNNFNQLVMQGFKILKMYVCFDLPLSTLNRVQAEQISDLDDFLRVESLQPSIEKHRKLMDSEASKTTSNGTPMNLLQEYRGLQDREERKELCLNLEEEVFSGLQHTSTEECAQNIDTQSTSNNTSLNLANLFIAQEASDDSRVYKVHLPDSSH